MLTSTDILFSPYTDSPGTMFFVTNASSFPRAMNTPKTRVVENQHLNKKVILLGLTESKPECWENLETDVIDQLYVAYHKISDKKIGEKWVKLKYTVESDLF